MSRRFLLPILTALLATACDGSGPSTDTSVVWRAGPPADRGASTAHLPRVEIAGETRPVLGVAPQVVIRSREAVSLDEVVSVAIDLPTGIAPGRLASVEAWISARARGPGEPAKPDGGAQLAALRAASREVLRAQRVVRAGDVAEVRIPVPELLRGGEGLLSIVARTLPDRPETDWTTDPLDIPLGARLSFAYAIEPAGWEPGWPPVAFDVRAEDASEGSMKSLYQALLDPANDSAVRGWQEADVDLAALAGQRIRLHFRARAIADANGVSVPRSLPVFASPQLLATPAPEAPRARNIVLISLDTLRAHSVGAYGSPLDTTPTLDRLAAEGALVRQAVSPFPFTPPSHMSMMTGLDPCMHGVVDRRAVLPGNLTTLAEWLSAAGYRTAAFTENGYVSAGAGFARGFDRFFEKRDEDSPAPGFAKEIFARGAAWLREASSDPFFLFLHTYEVHDPYTPPAAWADHFRGSPLHGPGPHRKALRAYEGEIRYTDELLLAFLEALEASGLTEDTIVVVTSDHGEAFGEHLLTGHGYDAHDESVLVPLALRAPGLVRPGTVVEAQVGLADVAPTLLELVGLDIPDGIAGQSFAGPLTGRRRGAFEERPILIHTTSPERIALRTRRYKYIDDGKSPLLHDLEQDPKERRRARDPRLLAEARGALETARAACEAWQRDNPPIDAERNQGGHRAPGWLVNRDEIDAQLRALGYAD